MGETDVPDPRRRPIRITSRILARIGAVLMIAATLVSSAPALAAPTSVDAGVAPQIWSFQPGIDGLVPVGKMMLVDFTQPMRPDAVRVDIDPPTKFWWHWSSPQQLVIQPQHNWLPQRSYRVRVTGLSGQKPLVGQREFQFLTGRAPSFGQSCALRTLAYHINGKPKAGELPQNFVSWSAFETQITQLQHAGYRFGAPDQVCAPGNEDMVSIQFDDGWATQFPAAQILARRGITAFFAVTLGNLDKPGYMTRTQVRLLPSMGMVVGSHLMTHDCITTTAARLLPAARQEYFDLQLGTSRAQLEQLTGQPVHFLVYPYGCFDVATTREVQKHYWAAWAGLQVLAMPADLAGFARQRFTVTEDVRFK
jgi:peptidoglycan/xylan/chitin deacetylase (PgdA/CDA1 family)